ncbi:putative nuclear mitotic apparatus protein 1 [Scophthalmus maximus]|uniref:Putative nuclear mitotic apparatus protein 1 n=1 Tax=Scophthalmus maximus TaxID=52904 RepID=A0A2U9B5G1_SCOMX|nr:putative nuclear mitotic apparatus protein 1 [Scophthalmus maximus]
MAINLGVKALLSWVNSIKLSDRDIAVDDLQDGIVFLKVIHVLKKQPNPCFSQSIEERFNVIANFVDGDCRFNAAKGTSLHWDNIIDGVNLTAEVAKVLLLLLYYDMMNDRCTLNMLECDVEREIANLTGSFVMESEGCVYLSQRLDAYLSKRHLPVSREIFERSATTSSSNVSTISSLSDDESPVFHRTQKITFVDMQTVASSSVSMSPLQDIMNTPKFQMRKMQRQMVKERDYRDGLERELSSKLALIAQKESHINQLQYRLDKLKEEQGDQEQVSREEMIDLETKNDTLQMRLNEMLKQNKDLKSTSSLTERKVDDLTEENGVLSSRMRAVCSQLAIFEAEVGRLTETQASAQQEWQSTTSHLQTELNQATAQKELLTEQIQILHGKISCLEDEIRKITEEEVGENMGPVMEREMVETEITGLKNELESTFCTLKKAEVEIQTKTRQLAEYQQEITQQKELLKQQQSQTEEMIQAKDEILDNLQKEITEQRAVLQREIQDLELQLEQVEQQKTEQATRLQQHIAQFEQEIKKLKEIKKEKEDVLHQTEERVKDLETKLSAASALLANKDQQITSLKEEAEQEIQLKQDLLAKSQQENIQQREVLRQQVASCGKEAQKLNAEIQVKNEQLVTLKNDSSQQSALLEQELKGLRNQVESLKDSLRKSAEQVQAQLVIIDKQEQESSHQKELLKQKLSASEDRVRSMSVEIQAEEEQMNMLKNQSSQQSELLHQEIGDLKKQVECLSVSLTSAEENLQSKESLFAKQQQQNSQNMEALQAQMVASQDEVKRLNAEIHTKEEQLAQLKTETSTHCELLQQEIEGLNKQIESMNISLEITKDQVKAKEELIAKQEQESTSQIEALTKHSAVLEDKVNQLREEIHTKEGEVDALKVESCKESVELQNEIQTLKDQVESLSEALKTATEQVHDKENLLAQKELEISQGKDTFQNLMATSEKELRGLREQIQAKEDQLLQQKKEGSIHSDMLQEEIRCLKTQLDSLVDSLTKAEEKVKTQLVMLNKQEQESCHQKELLQQQLLTSEDQVRRMKEEMQAKEEQMILLRTDGSEQSGLLNQEIQSLKEQVETLGSSLSKAEEKVKTQLVMLNKQEQESCHQKELLQQQLLTSEDQVRRMKEEMQAKEEQMILLRTDGSEQSGLLNQEIQSLKEQVETLGSSLSKVEEDMQSKEDLLTRRGEEIQKLKECQNEKESLLLQTEEKIKILQTELSAVNTLVADKDQNLNTLREEVATQGNLVLQAREEAEANERILAEIKEESSKQKDVLQNEIRDLKGEVKNICVKLLAKEQMLLKTQQVSSQQIDLLQRQLVSVNADLSQHKEAHAADLRLKEDAQELQVATLRDKEAIFQEKEVLMARIHQAENDHKALETQLKAVAFEQERLAQAKQAVERENTASRKLESALEHELEVLKSEKVQLLKENKKAEGIEALKRDLQEQLSAKSEAAEHYKSQMEKAVSHYNSGRLLLQECQQEVAELKHSIEVKESEAKTIATENKLLQLDLERAQTNETKLLEMVASLKAKLAFADHKLQVQNTIHDEEGSATELCYLDVPKAHSSIHTRVKRTISSDSLDQSSLEDSLNITRKPLAPGESSTPLVRSSERLAAKRRVLETESLESLYFTPINTRQNNRVVGKLEPIPADIGREAGYTLDRSNFSIANPNNVSNATFYSLASAGSQPNLSSAHSAQPQSTELFRTNDSASDQLIGLPGYRRSTIHSQTTSTFCVGAENEPDGGPDDWIRIAELQARNKACLPHLKSSYPVESETGHGGVLIFTDEEVRTGDPTDTIRRASTMPGQLQDSLVSHRHSLMMGQSGAAVSTRSHRLSLMPGQLPSKTASASQLRSPKGTKRSSSTLSLYQTSPEKKVKASCFPRPLTPKNKNVNSGSSSSRFHPVLSPADRRQSMVFTIDNTPKKTNYLKKGLNKLRTSTSTSTSVLSGDSHTGVGRAGRASNFKSPQVTGKGQRKSPQTARKTGKSPGLTASARKVNTQTNPFRVL